MSLTEIGEAYNVDPKTISNRMNTFGIPTEHTRRRKFRIGKQQLVELYVHGRLSTKEIGQMYGFSDTPVRYRLAEYNIPCRPRSERKGGHPIPKVSFSAVQLRKLYYAQDLSTTQLATMFNLHSATILYWLKKFNITLKQDHYFKSGENNPFWTGGYYPYYGPNWRQQRRLARKRATGHCEKCGSEPSYNLIVHHKKSFKKCLNYLEANNLDNLICLCRSCHMKEERNLISR